MTAELRCEELRRLVAGLGAFVRYQRRLGLETVPGTLATTISRPATPAAPLEHPPAMSLEDIRREMGDCRRCKLWKTRTQLVFGTGPATARLMFIGEAPGAEEDQQGVPFVGAAGQLLDRLLYKLEIDRQQVYITNVVKSHPPGNRNPEAEEIAACRPFLLQQIEAIRPRVIVTLGAISNHALLATKLPLSRLRGRWQQWQGIPVMPTFHPSFLLRVPQERIKTWEDMQKVLAVLQNPQEP